MSGQEVIAEIRAQGAEIRAQEAQPRALVAESRAELRAEIAAVASKVDANTARLAALDSRLDSMECAVYATFVLVVALTAARLLNWISGCWGNQRTIRNQPSGDGSTG